MAVRLIGEPFDPWREVARFEETATGIHGRHGATAVFVGTMRDVNQGRTVEAMTLEHYPAMAQRHLERIAQQAQEQFQVLEVLIVHRYGRLTPGDPIVLVAVWGGHRAEAFAACRQVIDELKARAPLWKLERTAGGPWWVSPEGP